MASSSGQDLSPSPMAQRAGEGATPPTASAGAQQPMPQAGALAQFNGLVGIALFFMDLAVRFGPGSTERDMVNKHLLALGKHFKKQAPPGTQPTPTSLPLAPGGDGGGGGGMPPGMMGGGGGMPPPGMPMPPGAGGPTAQPGTPNLPRGPAPGPPM